MDSAQRCLSAQKYSLRNFHTFWILFINSEVRTSFCNIINCSTYLAFPSIKSFLWCFNTLPFSMAKLFQGQVLITLLWSTWAVIFRPQQVGNCWCGHIRCPSWNSNKSSWKVVLQAWWKLAFSGLVKQNMHRMDKAAVQRPNTAELTCVPLSVQPGYLG